MIAIRPLEGIRKVLTLVRRAGRKASRRIVCALARPTLRMISRLPSRYPSLMAVTTISPILRWYTPGICSAGCDVMCEGLDIVERYFDAVRRRLTLGILRCNSRSDLAFVPPCNARCELPHSAHQGSPWPRLVRTAGAARDQGSRR